MTARRRRRPGGEAGASVQASETTPSVPSGADDDVRCRRCRRPLHAELARAAGLGPVCAQRCVAGAPRRVQRAITAQPTLPGLDEEVIRHAA